MDWGESQKEEPQKWDMVWQGKCQRGVERNVSLEERTRRRLTDSPQVRKKRGLITSQGKQRINEKHQAVAHNVNDELQRKLCHY